MILEDPAQWPPGVMPIRTSKFDLRAVSDDLLPKFGDDEDEWLRILRNQCTIDLHNEYPEYVSEPMVSLLRLQLEFANDIYRQLNGWIHCDFAGAPWEELCRVLDFHCLNSVDDVLVDWKSLFSGALDKKTSEELIEHNSTGGGIRQHKFISLISLDGEDLITHWDFEPYAPLQK
ncbi:hypothetical protein PG997_013331 [Apiospora hydei]|uniref:Uncharacterized protein n=1 Tax=Apiospora hydei TaxID=1337664 RepID=A0ABR1V5U8_9PEZI